MYSIKYFWKDLMENNQEYIETVKINIPIGRILIQVHLFNLQYFIVHKMGQVLI